MHTPQNSALVLFKSKDGSVSVDVQLDRDSVWLSLDQIAHLFARDKSVISRHLKNTFETKELERGRSVAKNATVLPDGRTYQVDYYNLDAIISVGYRINSKRGTEFRIWATGVLRQHLVQGFTANEKRLRELRRTLKLASDISGRRELSGNEATLLLQTVSEYAAALELLDDYDHQRVRIHRASRRKVKSVTYDEVMKLVAAMRTRTNAPALFGREKDQSLHSSLNAIMQSVGGKDLYPSPEEKAANPLYFMVKNHSFVDGNKRIAAAVFLRFADKNNLLYTSHGDKRIADNALVAMTLMIAESRPQERAVITAMLTNLITMDTRPSTRS